MQEISFSEENIEKIINYCERFIYLEQQLEEEELRSQVEISASNNQVEFNERFSKEAKEIEIEHNRNFQGH